jgi:hypothetical protein
VVDMAILQMRPGRRTAGGIKCVFEWRSII